MNRFLRPSALASLVFAAFACGGSSSSSSPSPDSGTGDDASVGTEGGTDGGTPDAQSCAAPRKTCAGACVDTTTDSANCGFCGHACATGATCSAGACTYDTGTSIVLAIHKLYLGDADRNGVSSAVAWKGYGVDIDGKTTDQNSTDVCTLAAGTPKSAQVDGTNGIDNSFGENILPIWLSVVGQNFSQTANAAIAGGTAETTLLRVDGVTMQPDAASAPGAVFVGTAFGSPPKWDGTDVWPIDNASVMGGNIATPALAYANGSMTSRVWTGAPAGVAANLPLMFIGDAQVLISKVVISMNIAQDGKSAVQGTISGVMPTNAYIAALQSIAGKISTSLCQSSAFDSISQQIRQAADILRDGSNMAGVPCEAISIGIGFDATVVRLGEIVTPPTAPNPCP